MHWIATLHDGRTVQEPAVKYKDLDPDLLESFSIVDDTGKTYASLKPHDGEVLFYHRTTFKACTPQQYYIIVFGTRKRISLDKVEKRIIVVRSDGVVFEDTEFRNYWFESDFYYPKEQV